MGFNRPPPPPPPPPMHCLALELCKQKCNNISLERYNPGHLHSRVDQITWPIFCTTQIADFQEPAPVVQYQVLINSNPPQTSISDQGDHLPAVSEHYDNSTNAGERGGENGRNGQQGVSSKRLTSIAAVKFVPRTRRVLCKHDHGLLMQNSKPQAVPCCTRLCKGFTW